jgi:mediator of RNA polymerase II transcription subunit 17, fungi type
MQHASLLLSTILATSPTAGPSQIPIHPIETQAAPPSTLATTTVSKPPQIVSVQAFNAQLAIGGKDEALRKAAGLFKNATERMEKGRIRNEQYWVDALKIRRANWSLVPAPLPFGSAMGRGADKTAKDFVISYGLEECRSPCFLSSSFSSADRSFSPCQLSTKCGCPYDSR